MVSNAWNPSASGYYAQFKDAQHNSALKNQENLLNIGFFLSFLSPLDPCVKKNQFSVLKPQLLPMSHFLKK